MSEYIVIPIFADNFLHPLHKNNSLSLLYVKEIGEESQILTFNHLDQLQTDNFDFLKDKTIEENTLYAIKDIIWYGTCDTIMKTDFYNDIVFYLGMDDVFLPMNYDAILNLI